jgi:hypothetical protein
MGLFQIPFVVYITEFRTEMQMEATKLQSNDSLKDAFSKENLLQLYG